MVRMEWMARKLIAPSYFSSPSSSSLYASLTRHESRANRLFNLTKRFSEILIFILVPGINFSMILIATNLRQCFIYREYNNTAHAQTLDFLRKKNIVLGRRVLY